MNTVELSVRSKLLQVVEELKAIGDEAEKTSRGLNEFAGNVGKSTQKQIKNTETFLGKLRGMMGSAAKAMSDDFKALFSMAGITEGLKLGNMFRDNIKETFELSDTIRKLANVFGIAEGRFVDFQSNLTHGLGEIGLSSESAINSLKGLSETQVRGEGNLEEYSKTSGQLASLSGQKGQEGTIAKGMAETLTSQGKSPNDMTAMKSLSDDLRKAFNATGKSPTELLGSLKQILSQMPQDLRKSISTSGLVKLSAASAVGGANSTKFLEEYLSKSPIARKALEARGFKGVFTDKGLDTKKFKQAAGGVIKQFPGDPRMMAQTLGLSEDAAEGFIRLYESIDKVNDAQNKMDNDQKNLTTQYYQSMTASESFTASLNKLKASLATPISFATNSITKGLQTAFQSSLDDVLDLLPKGIANPIKNAKKGIKMPDALDKNFGSTALVAGGGVLTALLAGGGLKKLMTLGKGKAQGVAERMAYENVTGAKVQDVYVVNAGEIGAANTGATSTTGMGMVGKVAAVTGAGAVGYEAGQMLDSIPVVKETLDKFTYWLADAFSAMNTPALNVTQQTQAADNYRKTSDKAERQSVDVRVKLQVDSKNKDLQFSIPPARGAMQ
jgi:hypothetical protein